MPAADLPDLLADFAADPLFWAPARLGTGSAWCGHVPFAHWLVSAIRPRLIVELGTQGGVSFAAFCEAVRRNALPARCIAIDLWEGDVHAGFYGESVCRDLSAFVARTYPEFAELRRSLFCDALQGVADGTIDLLHVDGRHRYDDVKEDFESWRPKLSRRAVVLFRDIAETQGDFGVYRYWAELTRSAPSFAFEHCHGLGVLAVGPDAPMAADLLCAHRHTAQADTLRSRFAALGERWMTEMALVQAQTEARNQAAHVTRLQAHIDRLAAYTAGLEKQIRGADAA